MEWNKKKIVTIGSGDIDFICKSLGLAGASGTYPCYQCVVPKTEMQKKPKDRKKEYPERKLERLREKHKEFLNAGGNRNNQAEYENVVDDIVVPIEPKKWCPPGLHMTMGGVQRYHGHVRIDVSGLDLDIGNDLAHFHWTVGNSQFDKYISLKKDLIIIEERLLEIDDEIDDLLDDGCDETVPQAQASELFEQLHEEQIILEERKAILESKLAFPKKGTGPLADSLDKALNKFGIERQAYHGSCFVGNHCHKYLQEEVYTGVLDEMVATCKTLTGNPDIIERAEAIKEKYTETFKLYSAVYKMTSHSNYIPETEHTNIQDAIDKFMAHYRKTFPDSSIPLKLHLMEDHMVPWLKEFPFGFGLMGEQGSESVHAQVNRIKRRYAAMKSATKRLHTTIQEQHLKCAPELKGYIPDKKKYKSKKSKKGT